MKNVKVKKLKHCYKIPEYKTYGSSGVDLYAAIEDSITLKPNEWVLVPTGICIEMERGFEAQVRSRSGLALKHGIFVLNSPGTIDSDYRGEIGVILFNAGKHIFKIKRGDRIAQLVFTKIEYVRMEVVNELSLTDRNEHGFGHTGV